MKELWVKGIMIENVVTAEADISLQRAIEILYEKHIGSLVVLDKEKRCKGIFTTRDAIRAIAGKIDLQTPLRDVMTRKVLTVPQDASFAHARDLMIKHKIRHLPVTDEEERLVGIVTIRHVFAVLVGLPTVRN
jgi:CBS domain-containing protein